MLGRASCAHCGPVGHEYSIRLGFADLRASDYVVRGVQGEQYPIKPDILRKTYRSMD